MKPLEYYQGREQTYLKHFFLEKYLERVAYHIGYFRRRFAYVDCFSGPWRSQEEAYSDTSFMIAVEQLRRVRQGLAERSRKPQIRCIFIEKESQAYQELERATTDITDINVKALYGEFERLVPEILREVGRSFAFFFIDPTGWTGFGLNRIQPILNHRPGEVLVNFMFDYINRFLEHPGPDMEKTFNELFAGSGWRDVIRSPNREAEIISFYAGRMKEVGQFDYCTWTRIMKPLVEKSYFYLVYGTRHPKGLIEFRGVEKKFVEEQERVRSEAKQAERVRRTGQKELFRATDIQGPRSYEEHRQASLSQIFPIV
ncbi:three-Cys-motif partner protein TcmP [Acidobacteria bacterium AH-259-L09]|nr:three-Cys-motif partner protein TcmP [Acidobacteria bacterium AH-259-L09]